jgi:hypothetical protein
MNTSETVHAISVDGMLKTSKRLVENYTLFVRHAPKLLRDSMMLAYQTAVDDMLKAMDHNRTEDPVKHADTTQPVHLVDSSGHAL